MPFQGHLAIGVPVHDFDEVRGIFDKLGIRHSHLTDKTLEEGWEGRKISLAYQGAQIETEISFFREYEGGYEFPVPKNEPETGAFVGFFLTSRYGPQILDRGHKHGRPEPFIIKINDVSSLLEQTRNVLPEAEFLIIECFF